MYIVFVLFQWDIVKTKAQLIVTSKLVMLNSGSWESFASLKNVYTKEIFYEPWVSQIDTYKPLL